MMDDMISRVAAIDYLMTNKVYLFNDDTLVMMLNVPTAHAKQAVKIMRRRKQERSNVEPHG